MIMSVRVLRVMVHLCPDQDVQCDWSGVESCGVAASIHPWRAEVWNTASRGAGMAERGSCAHAGDATSQQAKAGYGFQEMCVIAGTVR